MENEAGSLIIQGLVITNNVYVWGQIIKRLNRSNKIWYVIR